MGRSEAVGLVLARPARLLGVEPFFMEFIAGIEEKLAERGLSVLLHVVGTHEEEIATHRRWAERDLVEAVIVVNLTVGDRRPDVLAGLGLPAMMVGAWDGEPDVPAVVTDSTGPIREALARLLELGHRRIARVTGPGDLVHTRARTAALVAGCQAAGIEPVMVEGDYSAEAGAELTERLLRRRDRPTAIIYDNDVMAIAGLGAAKAARIEVPTELSLLAWDDSTMCRLASPPLSTMSVDVYQFGVSVAESVLELIDGRPVTPRWSPAPRFVARGSTAPFAG
ncbi:substrate-binding domain-containing protein [Streptomyces sp. DSM 44915]|uniref:Substrate-binding domain-containing protein n=1 Tax=Streptomyces chisholmiae TaxID=3075540 RepID=A0ABU2JTX5_9ACTN|nr:substrate-binding domain-containing protein [Streptomyces sp. DSM 44915]MDT0268427.1 substrate-binding domain-containing protein [Streptomyces sp. DSM 44915]